MTDRLLSAEQRLHITAVIVPPPKYIQEGAKEERLVRTANIRDLHIAVNQLLNKAAEVDIFAQGGTVVLMVQPIGKVTPNG